MANPFVHVELTTQDPDKAKAFYGSLFDWSLNDVEISPGFTYTMIGVGEGTGGGLMKTPAPGVPTAWLPYVLVADVAASTARAASLGATVIQDVTEVPDAGSFSIIIDPTGAAIGLWQPKAK
ncbi:VOC family protein [Methylocapsa acidiphila]|uniref:VOC family protein n=1 Tax=Methylocapsa acidiphila TaxID=133552 RepID=UPI0004250D15|nr:VOC family protein [Methylocapsa acidiphila]